MEIIIHDPIDTSGYAPEDVRQLASAIKTLQTLSREKIESELWEN
jgi:hypothetical protein